MNLQEFKQTFDLLEYVNQHFEVTRIGLRRKILCPFHDENTASCLIEQNRFYCFGCGENGSSIDFMMKYLGLTLREVIESEDFDAYKGKVLEIVDPSKKKMKAANSLSMGLVKAYAANLQRNPNKKQYLYGRHFDDESIDKAYIGWGKLNDFGSYFKAQRYSIPHFDTEGKLIGMRYRIDPASNLDEVKYLAHPGTNVTLYNLQVIPKHKNLVIVGSQLDAAALWYRYKVPAISPPSETSWNQAWSSLFEGKVVFIQYDNDIAGENGAIKVYKSIKEYTSKCTIYKWPHDFKNKDDTCDWLTRYGINKFKNLI